MTTLPGWMAHYLLVIEPNADNRDALGDLLGDLEVDLELAETTQQAQEVIAQSGVPCVIVLSCGPADRASAALFVESLRTRVETHTLPVAVLTTVTDLRPFDDRCTVLHKPFAGTALKSLIEAATSGCRALNRP